METWQKVTGGIILALMVIAIITRGVLTGIEAYNQDNGEDNHSPQIHGKAEKTHVTVIKQAPPRPPKVDVITVPAGYSIPVTLRDNIPKGMWIYGFISSDAEPFVVSVNGAKPTTLEPEKLKEWKNFGVIKSLEFINDSERARDYEIILKHRS